MLKKAVFILWCVVGLWIWCGGALAAKPVKTPWRLALVLEHSSARDQALGGTLGRQALGRALQMELRTLPLRIKAGMWLADGRPGPPLVPPAPAVKLRRVKLNIGRGEGGGGLDAALSEAEAWLSQSGGGSLLLIAATPPAKWKPPRDENIFCHVAALGPGAMSPVFSALAIDGGGAIWRLKRHQAAAGLIRQAITTAISPVRLVFETRDQKNQAVKTTVTATDAKIKDSVRTMATLRPAQIKAGAYKLSWPSGSTIAPGPLPDKVSVGFEGQTRVWVGGVGHLNLKALDGEGKELDWHLQITRVTDGEVVKGWHAPPSQNKLSSGLYIVNSRSPRHSWLVELGAGQIKELTVGPKAWLTAELNGPAGPVRLPYQVYDYLSGRRVATGYTGHRLGLMPGSYRLEVELPPGLKRDISLRPQEKKQIRLPGSGGLLVLVKGPKKPFIVRSEKGKVIAQGMPGRMLHLLPGSYRVVTFAAKSSHDAILRAGAITELRIK